MTKNFIVKGSVYPFDVAVSINESDEDFKIFLKEYGIKTTDKIKHLQSSTTKTARVGVFTDNRVALRTNFYPETIDDLAMIQHEIFHVVSFILDLVGMEHNHFTEEAYAYLIGFYTREIYTESNIFNA